MGNDENQTEGEDKKQPPLLYSQFRKFMLILKKYYLLCKVEMIKEKIKSKIISLQIFQNIEVDESLEISQEQFCTSPMQEKLSEIGKHYENTPEVFQEMLEDDQENVQFGNLAKWFLKLDS